MTSAASWTVKARRWLKHPVDIDGRNIAGCGPNGPSSIAPFAVDVGFADVDDANRILLRGP